MARVAHPLEVEVNPDLITVLVLDLFDSGEGEDAAVLDDADLVADHLRLFDVLGRHKDGLALPNAGYGAPDALPAIIVEVCRRFVQDYQGGVPNQSHRDG